MKDNYQICSRCVVDTTVPAVTFDENGICNYCKLHDKMEVEYPLGELGDRKQKIILDSIRQAGEKKKYDCVVGFSGGRDSSYILYLAKKKWNLSPLAVHFNDGFGNPTAGENMQRINKLLDVDTITISSDWRESKDLKLAFLKASVPDMEEGTDIGIASSLYGVAAKYNIKYIIIGQSFRTEGIAPLEWNYLDGKYLKAVHKQFGTHPLRKWKADDPGFNLDAHHMFYYAFIKQIKVVTPLYYEQYVRTDVDKILKNELNWEKTGAHYSDDLYQSLMTYVLRKKFGIDRRKFNYSALVRSGQMGRQEAIEKIQLKYSIEDPKIIDLCIKRLGLSREEYEEILTLPPKTFRDYPNNYSTLVKLKPLIKLLCSRGLLPQVTYDKYFTIA